MTTKPPPQVIRSVGSNEPVDVIEGHSFDPDYPEQVALRKNQGDPIIMYLIVRESLGMSAGKIGAQCAHASQMALIKHYEQGTMRDSGMLPSEELPRFYIFQEWLKTSFRKVVLRADDKEWEKVKACPDLRFVVVRDAGLTEVEAGSETVIGVFPIKKSECPKVIKRLQVLK